MGDVKIRVEMICKCGNTVEARSDDYNGSSAKDAIILYDHMIYICAKCGKTMSRRVVRMETNETEIVLLTGE